MPTKLHLNIAQGVIEVEGDEVLVRQVYEDFKSGLLGRGKPNSEDGIKVKNESGSERVKKRGRSPRRTPKSGDAGKSKVEYAPSFKKDLDLSKLERFYDQYDPKNHSEKILIFAVFLRDGLKIVPCTADDIFTCYTNLKSKTKIPQAFVQALRDADGRQKLINFVSPNEINIPISGENHFQHKLQKAKAEAA